MKKHILPIILAFALCVLLSACGGEPAIADDLAATNDTDAIHTEGSASTPDETPTETSDETPLAPDAPEANDADEEVVNTSTPVDPVDPAEPVKDDTAAPPEDTTPIFVIGSGSETENCEFTIDYVNITRDVLPPNPGRWYSHYEADRGKTYIDLCIAYKNIATSDVDADEVLTGTLIYADRYEYTGFSMIEEDSRSDFTYSNITSISPLATEYVHYLFEVPEEVDASGQSIVLKMAVDGADFRVIVREASEDIDAPAEPVLGKTSGEVTTGEVIVTKNAEFSIDYSDITRDVLPPQPGSWYSHYEADSGKVYVDICFAYKNTADRKVDADEVIGAKLKYAGKYEYTGFAMIEEDSRSDFTYANITSISPLATEYIHFLFEVPEEVESSGDSVVVTFTIGGNTYTYTVV